MTNPDAREQCLLRDNYECQLSKLFGISRVSGKPCSERLEAHHIDYSQYGHEDAGDLITVCKRCHDILTDAIRRERYSGTEQGDQILAEVPEYRKGLISHDRGITLSDSGYSSLAHAQWAAGRSGQRTCPVNQGD